MIYATIALLVMFVSIIAIDKFVHWRVSKMSIEGISPACFALAVKCLRVVTKKPMLPKELALKAGINLSRLMKIETGKHLPDDETLEKLLHFFGNELIDEAWNMQLRNQEARYQDISLMAIKRALKECQANHAIKVSHAEIDKIAEGIFPSEDFFKFLQEISDDFHDLATSHQRMINQEMGGAK